MTFIEWKDEVIHDLRIDGGLSIREIFYALKDHGGCKEAFDRGVAHDDFAVSVMENLTGVN